MKLSEAKELFEACQRNGVSGFIIKKHCWKDHPERKFSQLEVLNLLLGKGVLKVNRFPSAKPDSFLWSCKDMFGKQVQIAIIFDNKSIVAIAISAYRESKK